MGLSNGKKMLSESNLPQIREFCARVTATTDWHDLAMMRTQLLLLDDALLPPDVVAEADNAWLAINEKCRVERETRAQARRLASAVLA